MLRDKIVQFLLNLESLGFWLTLEIFWWSIYSAILPSGINLQVPEPEKFVGKP
jgi:hypothetical protein